MADDYVNVNFFWGGEIIRRDNDLRYSEDPKEMRYIRRGTTYDELKDIVFTVMHLSSYDWDVKLSFRYPQIGLGNVVCGFFHRYITSTDDVKRMLDIPQKMQMGIGDVSLFIELEKISNTTTQPSHHSYDDVYGTQQSTDYYVPGWSDQFYNRESQYQSFEGQSSGNVGGSSNFFEGGSSQFDAFQGDVGGSNSMYDGGYQFNRSLNLAGDSQYNAYRGNCGGSTNRDENPRGNTSLELLPPQDVLDENPCRILASNEAANEFEYRSSSDEEEGPGFTPVGSDDEDSENETGRIPSSPHVGPPPLLQQEHHVPTASWFETHVYNADIMNNDSGTMFITFDPQRDQFIPGSLFRDKEALIQCLKICHVKSDRSYIVERSSPIKLKVRCVVSDCQWYLTASKRLKHGMFEISMCPNRHTCVQNQPLQDHKKISIKMIRHLVKPHIRESPNIKVANLMIVVNDHYNHNVSYNKTWRGKQMAIEEVYGNWTNTYKALPMFLTAMVHANPSSAAVIDAVPSEDPQMNGTSICKRVFWCLKAMMDGWQECLPVISIDGTFLKGKYNGKLLVAMGVDSERHQYPLCYALVDEESYENWSWFLRLFRKHVCREKRGVCIISDRHAGILAAMRDARSGFVEPYGVHKFCLFHLRSNFSHDHPGEELRHLMWLAGKTTQVRKHEAYMKQIGEISAPALSYLRHIQPEKWTICYDTGHARYGQATTNVMEGFNGNIKQARFLPTTAMMEYLFYRTVKIVNTQRNYAQDRMGEGKELCARSVKILKRYMRKANSHNVVEFNRAQGIFSISSQRYEVKGIEKGGNTQVVNIKEMTCTCGKWACHRFPCSHVIAGCKKTGLNWRQWVDTHHYTSQLIKAWEPNIYPLAPTQYWLYDLPRLWLEYGMLYPDPKLKKTKKKRGDKGQSVRIRTEMDRPHTGVKCGRCNQVGHSRRSKRCPQYGT